MVRKAHYVPSEARTIKIRTFKNLRNLRLICNSKGVSFFLLTLYWVYKKKTTFNIHEYSLCFTEEKTFGPWDLRRIVIVFYWHNYLNKV